MPGSKRSSQSPPDSEPVPSKRLKVAESDDDFEELEEVSDSSEEDELQHTRERKVEQILEGGAGDLVCGDEPEADAEEEEEDLDWQHTGSCEDDQDQEEWVDVEDDLHDQDNDDNQHEGNQAK